MKMKIGVIAHIDHGKTVLTAAELLASLKETPTVHDAKSIDQIIDEEKSIKITARPVTPLFNLNINTGRRNSRRERRAKKRRFNKK